MYSITEGFSPILCCRPDVITLGNPFDTRVPDYSKQYVREIRNGLWDEESVVFRDFGGNDHRLRPFTA